MTETGFRFHAAPPDGHWFNDPTALIDAGAVTRLLVQHRGDAPDFVDTGWGLLESANRLDWSFKGRVFGGAPGPNAYSGCVVQDGEALEAWHTEDRMGAQRQVRRRSFDRGATWGPAEAILEPARKDWRDPFLFSDPRTGARHMLLARPCGFDAWRDDPPSVLDLWREDAGAWRLIQEIGPFDPAGVLWEMPALILPDRIDDDDPSSARLILSRIDRRDGRALGRVEALGARLKDGMLTILDSSRRTPVDCGPDFYAAIPSRLGADPGSGPSIIAWASNWDIARRFPWPQGAGGPITLPRRATAKGFAPSSAILSAFHRPARRTPRHGLGRARLADGVFALRVTRGGAMLEVRRDRHGALSVRRRGEDWLTWSADFSATGETGPLSLALFVDGPLFELYLDVDARWVTANLPGPGAANVAMDFAWFTRPEDAE